MKIKTDELNAPFQRRDKDFLVLLEGDPSFDALINAARTRCGIKELYKSFETPELYVSALREAEVVLEVYDLPSSWKDSVAFFIVTGRLSSPGGSIRLSGRQYSLSGKPPPLSISIVEKVSFDELWNFILENKPYIKNYLKDLPRKRPTLENAELKAKIFRKRFQENKEPKKILKDLTREFELDHQLVSKIDEIVISRWILDYKKALKGQSSRSNLNSRRKSP